MAPQGLDIAQDDSKVWVATASQQIYCLDTGSFAATRYMLPNFSFYQDPTVSAWQARQIFALADGTLFLNAWPGATTTSAEYPLIWNPTTNSLTPLNPPTGSQFGALWETLVRTGNAERVYSIASDSGGESFWYDVPSKSVSPAVQLGEYGITAAANFDGSEVAVYDANGLNMYDGNLNMLGPLPGGGIGPPLYGGLVFSPDGSTLYEESMPSDIPVIYTIGAHPLGVGKTFGVLGLAPAMDFTPASISGMSPPFYIPTPFAVDSTGMLLGIEDWGIAFDDPTNFQNYYVNQPGTPTFMQHMSPYTGPLSGGTDSSGFGNAVSTAPNVWYGSNAGTANVAGGGDVDDHIAASVCARAGECEIPLSRWH